MQRRAVSHNLSIPPGRQTCLTFLMSSEWLERVLFTPTGPGIPPGSRSFGRSPIRRTSAAVPWAFRPAPSGRSRSTARRQLEEKPRAGSEWQDNNLVFLNSKGKPLEAQNIVNRSFKPLLVRAGLPPISFHNLRHSYLSLLASRGEPIRDLQALAGHATASFTLQRYTHHYDSSARRTADAMGEILPNKP